MIMIDEEDEVSVLVMVLRRVQVLVILMVMWITLRSMTSAVPPSPESPGLRMPMIPSMRAESRPFDSACCT